MKPYATIKSWCQFLFGLLTIYLLVVVVLPILSNLPLSRAAIDVIEEQNIDPRALFYTESEQAVEAGREMGERMGNGELKMENARPADRDGGN